MRFVLLTERSKEARKGENISHLADLPGLCCLAAGGNSDCTDDLTLAWLLFYSAAAIMDTIQDQDDPEAWWVEHGPGVALSVATGIYFSAASVLNNLHNKAETRSAANEVILDFYQTLLIMSSGQYSDLVTPEPNLEQYWKFVEAKSGAFFSLACRCGARLVTQDQTIIQAVSDFGLHLGVFIQILDDLEDIHLLQERLPNSMNHNIQRGLPFIYALNVGNSAQKETLRAWIGSDQDDANAIEGIIHIIDQCGAALYVLTEMNKLRHLASEALQRTHAPAHVIEKLTTMVNGF